VASLLANLEAGARRRTRRHDGLSAEKKRKKKCKKCGPCQKCKKGKCKPKPNGTPCAGGSCQSGACRPTDQAPPCTDESCPLPPECSQQAFDACSDALIEAIIDDVEACQPVCQDVNSAECQACLEPIAAARMPEAEACIAESCGFDLQSSGMAGDQARKRSDRLAAEAWFTRTCERPCCYTAHKACQEDASYQALICTAAAVVAAALSGPGGAVAYAFCLVRLAYGLKQCHDRNACLDGACIEGDRCCPRGEIGCRASCCSAGSSCCDNGTCCRSGTHCCPGGGCCHDGDTCCFRQSSQTLFCCPPGAQCMQAGIPCCSNC
jgi:hypothetical protein